MNKFKNIVHVFVVGEPNSGYARNTNNGSEAYQSFFCILNGAWLLA
ncbi:MAG: hypothetical protein V4613_02010 [Bacteroidota bacterium]